MAHKIIWSLDAREDLRQIVTFIRQGNPDAAARFGYALIKWVDILENFPLAGRRVPEFGDDNIREVIHRPYRIIYVVSTIGGWLPSRGSGTARAANRNCRHNCSFSGNRILSWH